MTTIDLVERNVFSGETVSTGLSLKSRLNIFRIYYKAFFKLMSYEIQVKALKANLLISKINTKPIRN